MKDLTTEFEDKIIPLIQSASLSDLDGLRRDVRSGSHTTPSEDMLLGLIDVREDQVS